MSKSYIPTKWVGGKTIGTADVMNNIENGIVEVHDRLDIMEEQYTNDIGQLVSNTNLKVDTNLSEQNNKINTLVLDTTNQINANLTVQNDKIDTFISNTTLELNTYKNDKDTQINESLTSYENTINTLRTDFDILEQKDASQSTRFETIESVNTTQNTRLDKVEYQNKVQDTYIGGLFNENGDKRLTIEGAGNDLKLEGSKEGLVQVDKIVGNTIVNLCNSGDRELTLNGDIEGVGTFVTTTEGVDGGLVDVMCEGNTLVNLSTKSSGEFAFKSSTPSQGVTIPLLKQVNGTFTILVNIKENTLDKNCKILISCDDGTTISPSSIPMNTVGLYIAKIETLKNDIYQNVISFRFYTDNTNSGYFKYDDLIILEGDYTNKPIPTEYFEGIKSVGQDDVNGHGIEITSSNVDNTLSNTLTIPLSKPLRGLPNGVKDRPVKREGKWYIERKCGEKVLNGSENWSMSSYAEGCYAVACNINISINRKEKGSIMSNTFKVLNNTSISDTYIYSGIGFYISIKESLLAEINTVGVKTYLSQNPTTVIYELATPIYEPLDIPMELQAYLETTHISNNSIIPCNMQVKNTSYSALIKPSTLYTVVADTQGAGTLGVNLGGTKSTTSTNKLTITTPATLTDNELKLYGKGLKASKVRLLEGDETTLSYPYFEGLKSSFEDGLVTEEMVSQGLEKIENLGKYKASVKVRGKNLFNGIEFSNGVITTSNGIFNPIGDYLNCIDYIQVKPNTTYICSNTIVNAILQYDKNFSYIGIGFNDNPLNEKSFTTSNNCKYIRVRYIKNTLNYTQLQIEEGTIATSYEPYYERTETVYLNSPLLKGDEIVEKEDGLYHYRTRGKTVFNGSESEGWVTNYSNDNYYAFITTNAKGSLNELNIVSDKFKTFPIGEYEHIRMSKTSGKIIICISSTKLSSYNATIFKQWLQANPVTAVYELVEPYYEKVADYPLTLEIPNNATLTTESFIPCVTIKSTYTGNVPSVYVLEEVGTQNTLEINDTQIAVDFILMSNPFMMSAMTNLTTRGINEMGAYFAGRIIKGFLDYNAVITKYPEFKDDIDFILRSEGREDLIK